MLKYIKYEINIRNYRSVCLMKSKFYTIEIVITFKFYRNLSKICELLGQ